MYVAEKIRWFNFRHSRIMTKHFKAENFYGTCVCNFVWYGVRAVDRDSTCTHAQTTVQFEVRAVD